MESIQKLIEHLQELQDSGNILVGIPSMIDDLERLQETLAQEQYNRLAGKMEYYVGLQAEFEKEVEANENKVGPLGLMARSAARGVINILQIIVADYKGQLSNIKK